MEGRNPTLMTPQEILAEVSTHKKTMERSAARMRELSKVLHDRMRRNPPDEEDAGVYLAVANVWARFSGMVSQGISRTASADRLLRTIPTPEEKAEAERVAEHRKQRKAHRQQRKAAGLSLQRSPIEDLMEMYGSEEVIDAGR